MLNHFVDYRKYAILLINSFNLPACWQAGLNLNSMHEPTYRHALLNAWHLVWRNKIMWVFGVVAVFLGHFGLSGAVSEFFFPSGNLATIALYWNQFGTLMGYGWNIFWLGWLLLVMVAMGFVAIVGAASAQGALIASAGVWFAHRKELSSRGAWHAGAARWWPLFLVTLTEKVLLTVFLFVVGVSLNGIGSAASSSEFLGAILMVALGIFVGLLISVLAVYAKGYIVMDEASIAGALRQARKLLSDHFLVSLETSVILVAINLAVLIALTLGTIVLLVPTTVFTVLAGISGFSGLVAVGWVCTMVLSVTFVVFLGGIFNAFSITTWTYLFMKMHHEGVKSRVLRWFGFKRA